ncbi:TPA: phage terminase small subunit [Enterococcus faecium]|uniref:phage terminase small subunit n=1 Tax=Enterococcus faecium TaxID=1352 RepID=UPI0003AB18C4|nr:hypothetical protein I131_08705 [Enterococcus faecium CRL1879]
MARQRDPRRDEAKRIWLESNGEKQLKEIASELNVSDSQVRKWKSQDKWSAELKSNVTNGKSNVTNQGGAPLGNQNAKGNKGNSRASPPVGNKNAVTHGLFANWLPSETLEIMNEVATSKPEDILWNNIMIQYTAIIRAQKIMYVDYEGSLSKEVSKWSSSDSGSSEEYAIQYAWDKQANFMNAQSRAMSTLSSLIRQFVSIADEHDERRKKLEYMDVQVNLAKAQLKQLDDGYDSSEEQTVIIDDIPLVESEAGSNGINGQETNSN